MGPRLLLKPVGCQVWVGPIFTPGSGPCWSCLVVRLTAHRSAEAHVQHRCGSHVPAARPIVGLPSVFATAMDVAGLEVTKWLAGYRYSG